MPCDICGRRASGTYCQRCAREMEQARDAREREAARRHSGQQLIQESMDLVLDEEEGNDD